jgi:hypothetical protein
MALNGSGTYNREHDWTTDLSNSVPITASRMDTEMDAMATAISTAIMRDGQSTVSANIPMNSKKFTGLAAGASAGDSVRYEQTLLVGKHTVWVPASGMIPAATSGPTVGIVESSSNKMNYRTLDFDNSSDEYAHFQIALPKSYNLGTVTFQAWWSTSATDTDGVAWGLQAVGVADGDTIDASWGTAVVVTDDAQSAAGDVLVTAESGAITIAGTPADDDLMFFRLFRDVSDANDDMAEDARLIGIKLFITLDAGTDA